MTDDIPKNLVYLHRDRGYHHIDYNSDLYYICAMIDASELGIGNIIERVWRWI
jgi:hypothetical protein